MVLKYKDMHAFDNYKTMKIIYSLYRAGEVSVHRACCERATQPYSLGGGGIVEAPTYFDARESDYIVFQTGFDGWAIFLRLVCFFPGFIYLPPSVNNNLISRGYHIWHECQSNIWSSDTKTYMRLIITKQ